MKVLDEVADSQLNLSSEAARKTLANLITAALSTENEVDEYKPWPGLDKIHLTSDSEVIESPTITREQLVEQA